MENATPSFPAPPYSTGAGGKFRKPPVSRKRPSTPYDRPSLATANNKSDDGGGWLSKLVVNPARRLIVSGATRLLPSFFSNSESSSTDEYEYDSSDDRDNEDVDADAAVDEVGDARYTLEVEAPSSSEDVGPSSETDKLKGSSVHANVQQNKSTDDFDQIEHMLKGKQLSRDESSRLLEILKSRLVDDSNAEEENKAPSVISQGQDKVNELDREIPSMSKQYAVETLMPRLQSNIQDEVDASPIDIAKAYMGNWAPESGFNTYGNISTDRREHAPNNLFLSRPHFRTPSLKSSTCWPGAMVQDHRAYLTPQTQRSRYGLHNFPRTPYSRTKPKLTQLQGDSKSSNSSLTTFQQSCTPNPWQMKTSSDVMDGEYGSVGPIRSNRNKFVSEPYSEVPRSLSSAQIASSSNASRSFVPVFQRNPFTASTSNFHTADKHDQTSKQDANSAGPSNEAVIKILDRLDRHIPTPKQKETEWKRLPSQNTNSIMPVLAPVKGHNFQRNGVLSENRSFLKGTDNEISFEDNKKTSNAASKTFTAANEAGAGPSFGFKNNGVANEKSTATNINEKEKSQSCSFDNQITGQDLTRKRPFQPRKRPFQPISIKRPDPQEVISSHNGGDLLVFQ